MARRRGELPECEALFSAGSLTEDAMNVIATKAPAERDRELAELSPMLMHTQLNRILNHLPDQAPKPKVEPERKVRFGFDEHGWWGLHATLPPDEARGERAQVLVHLDGRSDGDGHARLHLGPQLPDALRRYLCCDAKVRAVIEDHNGAVLGISPLEPTVNPRLRAVIEQRDQGCRYPGCTQRRWVQVHHLIHREHGGLTVAVNLACLCPSHHRLHHQGAFDIVGNPETADGLRFIDHWGHDIGPPHHGPVAPPRYGAQPVFEPPTGERLQARWFTWN